MIPKDLNPTPRLDPEMRCRFLGAIKALRVKCNALLLYALRSDSADGATWI